ncbi:MAG: YkgJ family cysteine cluster protein [Candidatus Diapherotrites archaeon]|nr:YkgJ family cysteine cluster protein [Candidatus Diapherotrites archaeon]
MALMDECPETSECSEKCKAECCKRYWITLLPGELDRLADFAEMPRQRFIEEYCTLFADIFPMSKKAEGIVVFTGLVPDSIEAKAKEAFGEMPDFFLILPFIALKRIEGKCVFLNKENLCSVYKARPRQCALFPEISPDEGRKPEELYDFCRLAVKEAKGGLDLEHFKKMKDYFSEVEGRGFSKVWRNLPGNAVVKAYKEYFPVSKEDFLRLLGPYA